MQMTTADNTKVAASARFARSGVHASLCARHVGNSERYTESGRPVIDPLEVARGPSIGSED
jgi:hypothetical protein